MSNLAYLPGHEPQESPQEGASKSKEARLKDGFVAVPRELMKALANAPLTSREWRVLTVFQIETLGWHRPSVWLAASIISKECGLPETKCSEALNSLIRKRVLIREGGSRSPSRINMTVSEWDFSAHKSRVSPKRNDSPKWCDSHQDGETQSHQDGDALKERKENIEPKGSIDTSGKKPKSKYKFEQADMDLAEQMALNVDALAGEPGKRNLKAWANDIRLMRERDGHKIEQITYLINWVAKDTFWRRNVLSPAKLREKWQQLVIQAKTQHEQNKSRLTPGRHTGLENTSTEGLVAQEDGTYEF